MKVIDEKVYLAHYGILRKSGRYPWGSGETPYQRNQSFLETIKQHRKEGMTDSEIAQAYGMSTTQLRAVNSIARNENKAADISQAQRLKDRGWSNIEIGKRMNLNESTVRSLLKPGALDKVRVLDATTDMLKKQVSSKGLIDIGVGVEHHLGVSNNKLKVAVAKLKEEGYKVHHVKIQQLGTGKFTTMIILSEPGVEYKEVFKNRYNIKQISEHTEDGGRTWLGLEPVQSIDSKRVKVRYADEGGADADGVIYVRPGVDDISLGKSNYAQVRVAVDENHYLKGMAVYKEDLPKGVDLVYNVNKTRAEAPGKYGAMKQMPTDKDGNIDPDNPFGSTIIRQHGVMNVLDEEGSWADWSKTLSAQFLSKQNPLLAKQQLNMTFERKTDEFEEIMELTNPSVRRHLLMSFADDADSSAVHLKAASLPRQANHVLLPVPEMKPTEIYAPNYKNGDRVVLVRHPHAGVFEIPELIVNNKNRKAKKLIGINAPDAIGINPKVAQKLSGADFDGDTVLVIPNNKGAIKTSPALEGLKNFDPVRAYPAYEGMPPVKPRTKNVQMGEVSNLITDMSIKGASPEELARAVRHSMVVIDSEKHNLNYKLSAKENGIPSLKEKYQGKKRGGASTLISLKKTEERVPERKQGFKVDPETGRKIFTETGATYKDPKTGKTVVRTSVVKKLAETDDVNTLSSGTPIEKVYADHANRLKNLANTARRESVNTKSIPVSYSAKTTYADEIVSLKAKLMIAERNAPRERQAQIVANATIQKKRDANPSMTSEEDKKLRNQALAEARVRTGANKQLVEITSSEWDAIQSGAITNNMLSQILKNSDLDTVKKLATPKRSSAMSTAKASRARSMAASGYTQAEIAEAIGVSVSVVRQALGEG